MRQRLGEDLFRLVQVRTISFSLFLNQLFLLKNFLSRFTEYQLHEPDGGLGSFFFQLATCSAAELIAGSVQHGLLTP